MTDQRKASRSSDGSTACSGPWLLKRAMGVWPFSACTRVLHTCSDRARKATHRTRRGCLIFHNVCMMTRALHNLRADGVPIEADAVAALSPYIRSHISRFGQYNLDLSRTPAPVDYDLPILASPDPIDCPVAAVAA